MLAQIEAINSAVNGVVWGPIMLVLLVGTGIYLTFRTRGLQARRFGFILRYDEGWEDVTGYNFEPWHVRYVGLEAAEALHENPMPFETYLLGLREERLYAMIQGASAGEE